MLTTSDHSRQRAGLTYVYPVLSRRAGGLSIGINLNPNNACNWRCIYCQVPDLVRGSAPAIDLPLLDRELRELVGDVLHNDYLQKHVPAGLQRLNDIALSGNGEPTSAREIEAVVELIGRTRQDLLVPNTVKTVLITNGSLVQRRNVKAGLRRLAEMNGEVWFKVDRTTDAGIRAVNSVATSIATIRRNLQTAASLCPTWIQTCMFALDGQPPSASEIEAYLAFLSDIRGRGISIQGVLLYGIARPSLQPEAPRLSPLPADWMHNLGERIAALGYAAKVTP
ncbi:MAG: radical SAM protein [Deltaproteobacteria bacterium]|nr:radical SAM protein [Deltaproteobacteria bacterium]